jgi:hypothetical protein
LVLFEYDGTLFCGHDLGPSYRGRIAKNIFPFLARGSLKRYPNQKVLLQGVLWYFSIGKLKTNGLLETKFQVFIHQNILKL